MRRAYCRRAAGGKGDGPLVEPGNQAADRYQLILGAAPAPGKAKPLPQGSAGTR